MEDQFLAKGNTSWPGNCKLLSSITPLYRRKWFIWKLFGFVWLQNIPNDLQLPLVSFLQRFVSQLNNCFTIDEGMKDMEWKLVGIIFFFFLNFKIITRKITEENKLCSECPMQPEILTMSNEQQTQDYENVNSCNICFAWNVNSCNICFVYNENYLENTSCYQQNFYVFETDSTLNIFCDFVFEFHQQFSSQCLVGEAH